MQLDISMRLIEILAYIAIGYFVFHTWLGSLDREEYPKATAATARRWKFDPRFPYVTESIAHYYGYTHHEDGRPLPATVVRVHANR